MDCRSTRRRRRRSAGVSWGSASAGHSVGPDGPPGDGLVLFPEETPHDGIDVETGRTALVADALFCDSPPESETPLLFHTILFQ